MTEHLPCPVCKGENRHHAACPVPVLGLARVQDIRNGRPTRPERRRGDHAYWASVCTCGLSELERMGHWPEHDQWCEVPSPMDDDPTQPDAE